MNKLSINIFRHSGFCRVVLAAGTAAVISLTGSHEISAKTDYKLNDTVRVGFNALDYVLQKPLPSRAFPDSAVTSRLFVSGGIGGSMTGLHTRPGARAELGVGYWFTPVHGGRISFDAGLHSEFSGKPRVYFGSFSADYLMNFSALLRGYDSNRSFELIGGIGAEYQRIRRDGVWGNEGGFRTSLQARFNVSRSMFLYVEPRLTLLAGTQFGGGATRRFHPDANLFVGLGYRLLRGSERRYGSSDFLNIDDSHIFFSAGAGATAFLRNFDRNSINGIFSASFGKWLTYTSALRVKAEFGRYGKVPRAKNNRYIATGAIDYVWNITNAFGGYNPDGVFGLNFNIGPLLAYGNSARGKLYPGAEASLTASFRLSPNWSLFIEPQVQVFSGKFSTDMGYGSRQAIGSLTAGVHYTFGNFYHDYPKALEEFLKDRNWFLTLGFSPVKRFRGDYGNGMAGSVGFGRRFTPISSWRITAEGEIFRRQPIYVSATVAADYLFSISTAMAGYDSERLFDLSGVMGVFGGVVNYVDPAKAVYGGKIGLNGSFRLNDALSLFVEPQLLGVCPRGLGNPGWTPELRVMLGLNYRLGTFKGPRGSIADAVFGGDNRNFVSLAGGPTVNSSDNDRASGALQASVGRWFSLVSGLRFNLGYDFLMSPHRDNVNLTTANIDYLLNVTSLIDRNPKRRFHIIGAIGGGLGFSNARDASTGAMGNAGLQFRYNLPSNIDLHIEPCISAYMNRVIPAYGTSNRFITVGRILAGASYRF